MDGYTVRKYYLAQEVEVVPKSTLNLPIYHPHSAFLSSLLFTTYTIRHLDIFLEV